MMPFILRIHNLESKATPFQAMQNVANLFRDKAHFREPNRIDYHVQRAYEFLLEAEMHYTERTLILKFICPEWRASNDRGYSYLEKARYNGKSQLMIDFYKGRPAN